MKKGIDQTDEPIPSTPKVAWKGDPLEDFFKNHQEAMIAVESEFAKKDPSVTESVKKKLAASANYINRNKVKATINIGKYVLVGVITAGVGLIPMVISDVAKKAAKHGYRGVKYKKNLEKRDEVLQSIGLENYQEEILKNCDKELSALAELSQSLKGQDVILESQPEYQLKLKIFNEKYENESIKFLKGKLKNLTSDQAKKLGKYLNNIRKIFIHKQVSTMGNEAEAMFAACKEADKTLQSSNKELAFKTMVNDSDTVKYIGEPIQDIIKIEKQFEDFSVSASLREELMLFTKAQAELADEMEAQLTQRPAVPLDKLFEKVKNGAVEAAKKIVLEPTMKGVAFWGVRAGTSIAKDSAKEFVKGGLTHATELVTSQGHEIAIKSLSDPMSIVANIATAVVQSVTKKIADAQTEKALENTKERILKGDQDVLSKISDDTLNSLFQKTRDIFKSKSTLEGHVKLTNQRLILTQDLTRLSDKMEKGRKELTSIKIEETDPKLEAEGKLKRIKEIMEELVKLEDERLVIEKPLNKVKEELKKYDKYTMLHNMFYKEIEKRVNNKLYGQDTGLVDKQKKIFDATKPKAENWIKLNPVIEGTKIKEISASHQALFQEDFSALNKLRSQENIILSEYTDALSEVMTKLDVTRNKIAKENLSQNFAAIKELFDKDPLFAQAKEELEKLKESGKQTSDMAIYQKIFFPIDDFLKMLASIKNKYSKLEKINNNTKLTPEQKADQRAIVKQELLELYKKQSPTIFNVIAPFEDKVQKTLLKQLNPESVPAWMVPVSVQVQSSSVSATPTPTSSESSYAQQPTLLLRDIPTTPTAPSTPTPKHASTTRPTHGSTTRPKHDSELSTNRRQSYLYSGSPTPSTSEPPKPQGTSVPSTSKPKPKGK